MANLNFEELLVALNNAGIAASQPALYQALKNLINKNTQFQKTYNTEQSVLEQKISNVLMFGTEADRAKYKPQLTIGNILIFYATDSGVLWIFDPSRNDWFPVGAPIDATYLTWTDESARLPNSRELLAGTNITFDDTVANRRTINSGSGSSRQFWRYKAKTSATSGYPGNGYILWNNATQISATSLLFSHLTDDGLDIDLLLALVAVGTTFILQDADASGNHQEWITTGVGINTNPSTSTSYWTFPVSLVNSAGTGTTGFSNNHQLVAIIYSTITPISVDYVPMSTGAEPLEIMSNGAGSVLLIGYGS